MTLGNFSTRRTGTEARHSPKNAKNAKDKAVKRNRAATEIAARENADTEEDSPDAGSASVFAGGTGTEDDPYVIRTAEALSAVRNDLTACYRLDADIDPRKSISKIYHLTGYGIMSVWKSLILWIILMK